MTAPYAYTEGNKLTAFTHLHVHTEYSLLDGASKVKQLAKRAKELGQTALAITDYGTMYGCIDFYEACKAEGIKPIIGCEVYVAPRTRFDKQVAYDKERYHLILLAKNEQGYKNLVKIVSAAWTEGFYTKPRVDHDLLTEYHEGIIALSACLAGEIPRAISQNDYQQAKETALWYQETFGEGNFYLELQDHNLPEQKALNPDLIRLSRETGIPLVVTNDSHYIKKEDAEVQKILICIQTGHTIDEDTGLDFSTEEFYLKSGDEMAALFPEVPEAISNTNIIAEQCNFDYEFGNTILPKYEAPDNRDNFEFFTDLCHKGLVKNYGEDYPVEYKERLDYELEVIEQMGFIDYFLIVWDYINYAKSIGIPVGPGRGSGAGSIAAYCCGITDIDPMRYSLLFERFLNPERISMPDFDIDFCQDRRGEVIEYVKNRYGEDHVAQIATFSTMAAKGAVRDVGRVLGMSYADVNAVAKEIPQELDMTIQKALDTSQDLRKLYDSNPDTKRLIDTSIRIEGMPRNVGMHAAGVVICRDPVVEYVPLALSNGSVITQFSKGWVEELGLLKMDFLGLKTLTMINNAQQMIRMREPDFDVSAIPADDAETYEMLGKGGTYGVFQCESAGIRALMIKMQPKNLEDIIAVIALYRPGPMDFIPAYLENRKHPDKIKYRCPQLKPILDVTYGTIVYQEQVMQIFRDLAGYTMGAADMVRRAISKKKADVLAAQKKYFLYGSDGSDGSSPCVGCIANGISEKAAIGIFDDMAAFASYAFNKSHSAAYALITYQTAYLRCHYPAEFMAAMLSINMSNTDKVVPYIAECGNMGIQVLPPHVNESEKRFAVIDGHIRFGMLAIKALGEAFIDAIIKERERGGEFLSFYDFCKRCHGDSFNRRGVENLIKAGALDNLGWNRRQMLLMLDEIVASLQNDKKKNVDGQIGFFDLEPELAEESEPIAPNVDEIPEREKLRLEKETTGIYMTGHPCKAYAKIAEAYKADRIDELHDASLIEPNGYENKQKVTMICTISAIRKKITRNESMMAFMDAEDTYGKIEAVVFPKAYDQIGHLLIEDKVVIIQGTLNLSDDKEPSVSVDSLEFAPNPQEFEKRFEAPPPEYAVPDFLKNGTNQENISEQTNSPEFIEVQNKMREAKRGVFLRFSSTNDENIQKAVEICFESGDFSVHYFYSDVRKYEMNMLKIPQRPEIILKLQDLLGKVNVVIQ